MPALEPLEALERAKDWMEVLFGTVPEHWLDRSLTNAIHERKPSAFPVNAYEILDGYKRLKAMGVVDKPLKALPLLSDAERACERCQGSGMELVCDATGNSLGRRAGCTHAPVEDGEGIAIHFATAANAGKERHLNHVFAEARKEAMRICDGRLYDLFVAEEDSADQEQRDRLVAARGQLMRIRRSISEGGMV